MKLRHQGLGAAAPKAPPSLRASSEVLIYTATELPNGKVRLGYQIRLDGKIVAEPKETFRTRLEVFKHADGVMDSLLTMFGEVAIRLHDESAPKLTLVDGGLSATATTDRISEEPCELRLAA